MTKLYKPVGTKTLWPLGSIYISVINENPSKYFGGTWVAFGTGRCLVGVDTSQSEFNSVMKTGGEKKHTLSISEMPSHTHTFNGFPNGNTISWEDPYRKLVYQNNNTNPYPNQAGLNFTGGSQAHNNLQPYITVYMWRRTN